MSRSIMVWDLGATKCAVALVIVNDLHGVYDCRAKVIIKLSEVRSLNELIDLIESKLHCSMSHVDAVCIGAAGQYDGQELFLQTHYPFRMNFAEIAIQRVWPSYVIVHDYATVVCATFTSYLQNAANLKILKSGKNEKYGRRVALGIGTGLGLKDAILLKNGDFWLGKNEAGHIGLVCPQHVDADLRGRHNELIHFLASNTVSNPSAFISFESILSGQGLVRLHQFLYPNASQQLYPEEIGAALILGKSPELQAMFAWYLGLYVGTVELLFMPEGGCWITGGVALHLQNSFENKAFFMGMGAAPAYTKERMLYPLGIMMNTDHAFWGGAFYAATQLFPNKQALTLLDQSAAQPLYEKLNSI